MGGRWRRREDEEDEEAEGGGRGLRRRSPWFLGEPCWWGSMHSHAEYLQAENSRAENSSAAEAEQKSSIIGSIREQRARVFPKDIAFVKTYKTAGTTLAHVLFRISCKHG